MPYTFFYMTCYNYTKKARMIKGGWYKKEAGQSWFIYFLEGQCKPTVSSFLGLFLYL
jgi:hypothetical protein